eukprot:gene13219-14510_t
MIKISDIPEAIFPIIQSFLMAEDYHYFIHTDKRFFEGIKQKTIYYSFNYFYSIKYVMDKAFQTLIQGKVNDTSKQVCLLLDRSAMSSQVLLLSVHQLILNDGQWEEYLPKPSMNQELPPLFLNLSSIITSSFLDSDDLPLPFLPSLKELTFNSNSSLLHITTIRNLLKLSLYFCPSLLEITIDYPLLELDLQGCRLLRSINPSGNNPILAKTVLIQNCHNLHFNDFQQYSQIQNLTISECRQDFPTSLKHLKGIHSLSLIECSKLSNISELGNHYQLEISFNRIDQATSPLVGYEILQGISHVILKRVNIVDVHVLREAKSLYLEYCEGITDVSPLMNIMDLTVDKCWNISNLHLLTKIPRLFLTNIKDAIIEYQERDSSDYKHQILSIQSCSLQQSFFKPMLCLYKLFLGDLNIPLQFNDDILSSFPLLQYIGITRCEIQSMKGLGRIHTVEIRYCNELEDINGLGENHTVILSQCGCLDDVRCLVNVPVVTIIWCDLISERAISLLRDKVPRFTYLN